MRSSPVLLFSVLGWALPSVALAQSPAPYFQPGAAPPPASAFAAPPGAASAPAQAILAGTVPVHFVGPSGERLHVSVSGAVEAACDLPCTLHLPPGEASVEISGDDHFRTSVRVPEDGGVVEVSTGSTGLMVTGIVLLAAGAGTSTVLFSTGTSKDASEMTKEEARGRFIIALGCAALAVTGLVLWLSAGRDGAEMKPGRSHVAKAPGGGLRFRGVDVAVGSKHDAMLGAAWSF